MGHSLDTFQVTNGSATVTIGDLICKGKNKAEARYQKCKIEQNCLHFSDNFHLQIEGNLRDLDTKIEKVYWNPWQDRFTCTFEISIEPSRLISVPFHIP